MQSTPSVERSALAAENGEPRRGRVKQIRRHAPFTVEQSAPSRSPTCDGERKRARRVINGASASAGVLSRGFCVPEEAASEAVVLTFAVSSLKFQKATWAHDGFEFVKSPN